MGMYTFTVIKITKIVVWLAIILLCIFYITTRNKNSYLVSQTTNGEQMVLNQDNTCYTEKDLPKNDEYATYKLNDCGIGVTFSKKALDIMEVLHKNYESLYTSRLSFDKEIKQLHDVSKDMIIVWSPEMKSNPYLTYFDRGEYHSYFNIGKYKVDIVTPTGEDGFITEDKDLYTKIVITENGKEIKRKEYKGEEFRFIYKIIVNKTEYYLLGLCHGGMHGCQMITPLVYDENIPMIGKEIKGDFSNYLRDSYFFTRSGELYTVIDDSRYFFEYSSSNNSSYNSAVPLIMRFDKHTANTVNSVDQFREIYKKSVDVMTKDLYTLKTTLGGVENNETRVKIMGYSNEGSSLEPYFDYYLGMSIISSEGEYLGVREKVKSLYSYFYGDGDNVEMHFDGYKDFEK